MAKRLATAPPMREAALCVYRELSVKIMQQ